MTLKLKIMLYERGLSDLWINSAWRENMEMQAYWVFLPKYIMQIMEHLT